MTGYKAILTCTDKHLHDCDTLVCEQTAFLKAFSALLGAPLTSDLSGTTSSRRCRDPEKDSEAYQAWEKANPQLQSKDSEAYQAWEKATPQLQSKDSEAYQAWAKATPQLQSKDSEAYQAWAKATPSLQPKKTEAFRE